MITIPHWPAIVLANYRTGSSPLTLKLAEVNQAQPFVEPSITEERTDNFINYKLQSDRYVVKFMPDQIDQFPLYKDLLDTSSYRIKISRKDKVQQIASHYIATVRNKWWTTEQEQDISYFVPISHELLDNSIKHILTVDTMLDSYKDFDVELYYEDLNYLENIDRKPASKPQNLNFVLNLIKAKL
jgi:hypothetical protein